MCINACTPHFHTLSLRWTHVYSLSHTWFETDDEKIWPLWPADHWSCTTDHLWKTCKNRWTKSDKHSTGAADRTKTPGLNNSASTTLPGYKRHSHHNWILIFIQNATLMLKNKADHMQPPQNNNKLTKTIQTNPITTKCGNIQLSLGA